MTIELLKSNIEKQKEIMNEVINFYNKLQQARQMADKGMEEMILTTIAGLVKQLQALNSPIPNLIEEIKFYKNLKGDEKKESNVSKELIRVNYKHPEKPASKEVSLAIKKKDQSKFLEGLTKEREAKKRLEKKELKIEIRDKGNFLRAYIRISNKLFRKTADNLVQEKYFDSINSDLRKIASPFLISSYVSMMLFSTLLAFIFAIFLLIPLLFFNPIIALLVFLVLPFGTFGMFLLYPSSQRGGLAKGINQELPFVVIYMGSVATSGIEPTKIFSILARTKDYPVTNREVNRLLNYINFYGYDLVSALKFSSKYCPSEKLGMLFNGLATTIRSGGELAEFLNKHAEGLLFDYRLEREKYTKMAETFMDIYISILIAAPMIMMILFVLLNLTGYAAGVLTPTLLTLAIVSIISVMNVAFLFFLNLKQPKY